MSILRPWLALVLLLLTAAAPADSGFVTPPGGRIGMVPPAGFIPAKSFSGFENPATKASIVLTELNAGAGGFAEIRSQLTPEALAQQGMPQARRVSLAGLPFEAVVYRAQQPGPSVVVDKWLMFLDAQGVVGIVTVNQPQGAPGAPPAAIEAALKSVRVAARPLGDPVAALPFVVTPAARFKHVDVMAGRLLLLKETPPPPAGKPNDPALTIGIAADVAIPPEQQQAAGEQLLMSLGPHKVQKIVAVKPITVGGLSGYEYVADAISLSRAEPTRILLVMLYQGERSFFLMGLATPQDYDQALPDFRKVIASFRSKL